MHWLKRLVGLPNTTKTVSFVFSHRGVKLLKEIGASQGMSSEETLRFILNCVDGIRAEIGAGREFFTYEDDELVPVIFFNGIFDPPNEDNEDDGKTKRSTFKVIQGGKLD